MDFLSLAFLFLIAGVVAVPLASKFGLGSVLGYLIAGIAISPLLAAFNVDVISLQHFAEFGVVMMLFLVGLELEPKMLWQMKTRLLGLGGLQVGITTVVVMGVAMLFSLPWTISLAIGLIFALSSTAIVLQTLNEKGLMKSDGGQASFSVLLFQDIAVIPMLALIPLLADPDLMSQYADMAETAVVAEDAGWAAAHAAGDAGGHGVAEAHGDGDHHGPTGPGWIETIPGWQRALITIAAIAAVIVGGSYLTRPIFRFIALAKLRELFTATALMMVIGIALLMTLVGLSPALGTFLAGVVLANSEYRHELESDIDPFKGLLLGLFFMTVGAGIDFDLLFGNFGVILGLTLGLIALKSAILLGLSYIFNVGGADRWLFTLGLAQAGEFGFVLLSFTVANDVVPGPVSDQLLLIVALSMLLTPALFIAYDKLIAPRFAEAQAQEPDAIDDEAPIIIAGHGRWGGIVNRMLLGGGYKTVVLDHNSAQLDMLRTFGFKVFFGDATRPDLLHAAGIHDAKMIVVAIDDRDQATELVHHVAEAYPHVHIIARARDRNHVYELYAAGCRDIIRETFDSGVRAGRSAFEALGMHPFDAERLSRGFVDEDRRAIRELAQVYRSDIPIHENEAYVARALELRAETEAEMRGNGRAFADRIDRGWSPPTVRDVEAETEEARKASV
ncbi:MAG: cation:proton antiporter [Rhodobacter sp.]|nr:cation:proton antiporter [Rhodobacter sp.]